MLLAVDVYYEDRDAFVAGVTFNDWRDEQPLAVLKTQTKVPSDYRSGEFYLRELPCLLAFLASHELRPTSIIVDGFVFLDGEDRPGLGKYLYDALNQTISVIGVAKNPFGDIPARCEVRRGGSKRPLYVTSAGMSLDIAKDHILEMHGQHRVPTLLRLVDAATKSP